MPANNAPTRATAPVSSPRTRLLLGLTSFLVVAFPLMSAASPGMGPIASAALQPYLLTVSFLFAMLVLSVLSDPRPGAKPPRSAFVSDLCDGLFGASAACAAGVPFAMALPLLDYPTNLGFFPVTSISALLAGFLAIVLRGWCASRHPA